MTRAEMYQMVREALIAFHMSKCSTGVVWRLCGCNIAESIAALDALEAEERCGECGGTGELVNDGPYSPCGDCNGTGNATPPAPPAAECAARNALKRLLKAASESGTCCDSAVIPNGSALHFSIIENQEFDDACEEAEAALSAPRECQRLREELAKCHSVNEAVLNQADRDEELADQYRAELAAAKSEIARLTAKRDHPRGRPYSGTT